jgi:hypothetical protein
LAIFVQKHIEVAQWTKCLKERSSFGNNEYKLEIFCYISSMKHSNNYTIKKIFQCSPNPPKKDDFMSFGI